MAKAAPKPKPSDTSSSPAAASPVRVRTLRKALGLTQEELARLIGATFVSVNRWENNASTPTGLSAVVLELLRNAMNMHPPDEIVVRLRAAGHRPVEIVRVLVELEKSDARR